MKLVTIVGARPQFIKAATVSRAINRSPLIEEKIVHTGQHFDANMSDVFFHEMKIPTPHYHLNIGGGTHGKMTGRQLEKIEEVLLTEKPDMVMVYGDTNSTLAGALAASKLHIPIVHVEAGLRSFNRRMPEEINRVLTDHISTWLFAPTDIARSNLLTEGISGDGVVVVGDVMYDVALFYKDSARKPAWFDSLNIASNNFILCTIHRAENTDNIYRLKEIMLGLGCSNIDVVIPLHPRTRQVIENQGVVIPDNCHIVEPVGYLEMVWLEVNSKAIVTDSGGVQKEAFFHGKPCLTLRDETEWIELVTLGVNKIVGARSNAIKKYLLGGFDIDSEKFNSKVYGKGDAAEKIVSVIAGGGK